MNPDDVATKARSAETETHGHWWKISEMSSLLGLERAGFEALVGEWTARTRGGPHVGSWHARGVGTAPTCASMMGRSRRTTWARPGQPLRGPTSQRQTNWRRATAGEWATTRRRQVWLRIHPHPGRQLASARTRQTESAS